MSFAPIVRGSFYQNPSLQYGPMIPGQDRNAPIPGWGMNPYWAGPPRVGVGAFGADIVGYDCNSRGMCGIAPNCVPCGESKKLPTVAVVAIGAAVVGLIGFAIYANFKVASKIAEKEGSAGLLKYELGTAAIGAGARAVDRLMDGDRYRRNRRRVRRRRRHNDE